MFKIAIFNSDEIGTKKLFETMILIMRKNKIKGEIVCFYDEDKLIAEIENENNFDLLFLNINTVSGYKIAQKVRRKTLLTSIVFTYNADDGLIRGLNKFLILRPSAIISNKESVINIEKITTHCFEESQINNLYFIVKNKEMCVKIDYKDILYFESNQRTVTVYTKKKKVTFYSKLSDVAEKIPGNMFLRCHQSFLVNILEIEKIDKIDRKIFLKSGEDIDISKNLYSAFIKDYDLLLKKV